MRTRLPLALTTLAACCLASLSHTAWAQASDGLEPESDAPAALAITVAETTPTEVPQAAPEAAPQTAPEAPRRLLASESGATAPTATHFQQLLQGALARDPQVQGAAALVRVAQAQLAQVRSRWFPSVGLNASKTRSQDEDLGTPIERNSERLDATFKWNLYSGGADQALIDSLERDVAAAELDLQRAREECAERLASAYADAVRADTVVATATELMERLRQLKALVDKQVASGKSSDVDAQTSASSLLEVAITHADAQADARRARLKLSALSGKAPEAVQGLSLPPSPALDDQHPADWLDLREGNARYQAARQRAESARLKVGQIAAVLQPRVDLQVRRALSDHTDPTPTSNTRTSTGLSVSLEMPLGGESFARRDEGLQRAEAAAADAERISLEAQIDWADAADRLATARHTQGIHLKQLEHLERVLRGAAVQFEAGRRSLVQLIDLQKMPFSARQKLAESRATQFTAQVRMLSLSGGLIDALQRATVAIDPAQGPVH